MVVSVYCTVMETTHYTVSRSDTSTVWPLPSRVPRPCTFVTCSTNSVQILYCMQVTNVQRPENKATSSMNEEILWTVDQFCLSDLCKIKYNIQKMKLLWTITQSWQIVQGTFMRSLKPHPLPHPLISEYITRSWDLLICVRKECYHGNTWTNG